MNPYEQALFNRKQDAMVMNSLQDNNMINTINQTKQQPMPLTPAKSIENTGLENNRGLWKTTPFRQRGIGNLLTNLGFALPGSFEHRQLNPHMYQSPISVPAQPTLPDLQPIAAHGATTIPTRQPLPEAPKATTKTAPKPKEASKPLQDVYKIGGSNIGKQTGPALKLTGIGGPQTDINVARQRAEYLQRLSQDKLEQELAGSKAQQQAMTNYRAQQEALQSRLGELSGDDPTSIALRNNVIRQIKAANLAAPQYLGGNAGPSSEDLAKRAGTQGMLPYQLQSGAAGLQKAQAEGALAMPTGLADITQKSGIGQYYKAMGDIQPAKAEADKGEAAAKMLTAQKAGVKPLIDAKDALAALDNPAAPIYMQALRDTGGDEAQAMAITNRWIQQNSGE